MLQKMPLCTSAGRIVSMLSVRLEIPSSRIKALPFTTDETKLKQTMRHNGFFLDAACIVLLYDVVRNPATYTETIQYVDTALHCFNEMTQDEPIIHCERSIQQILRVVTQTVLKHDLMPPRQCPTFCALGSTESSMNTDQQEQNQSTSSLDMLFEPTQAQFDTYCLPTWGYEDHFSLQLDQVDSGLSSGEVHPFRTPLSDVITSNLSSFFRFT